MRLTQNQQRTLRAAAKIQESAARYQADRFSFSGTELSKDYFFNRLYGEPIEHFDMAMLTNQHELIETVRLSSGTIDGASVFPREVMRAVMEYNAAAVVFAHNHPSGIEKASGPDIKITMRLKEALATIEVRVLDHIIVGDTCSSMAEEGHL
jgi:DNA repair protein RadC